MNETIYAVDKVTLEVDMIFNSARECASAFNIDEHCIRDALKGNCVSKGKYIFRYERMYDKNETYEGKRNRPVIVTNTVTGNSFTFYDISTLCDGLDIKRATAYSSISKNRLLFGMLKIEYAR